MFKLVRTRPPEPLYEVNSLTLDYMYMVLAREIESDMSVRADTTYVVTHEKTNFKMVIEVTNGAIKQGVD